LKRQALRLFDRLIGRKRNVGGGVLADLPGTFGNRMVNETSAVFTFSIRNRVIL